METSTLNDNLQLNDNLSLNENPLIARIVAGAIVDKLTSPQKDVDDEQLQQENAVLMTKVKNLATKRNFNTLKNKLTNKIKGQTAQKVKTVAKKQKKPPKPPKPPKPKPKAKVEPKGKGKQIIKKSTQAIAKGILSALGGK